MHTRAWPSSGYVSATPGVRQITDPGTFVELPLANKIRGRPYSSLGREL